MNQTPAVSVVMPIYNAEPYLRKALDSVLEQTLDNIEVVCVNDGSKDSSLAIMKEYASHDERIRIIDKPNGGYGHAMNVGIAHATGEYIGIVEPDDYIKPTMYEALHNAAVANDLDFVRSNYARLTTNPDGTENLQEVKVCNKPEYYGCVLNPQENVDLFNIRMENWTGIYKRSFVTDNGIAFNESPGAGFQDNGFWFQTYCYAKRIMIIDQPFYCYRVDNEASSINQTDKVFVMLDEYAWIEAWLRSHPNLAEKFMGIFLYKKTHNCEFALSRLANDYKNLFLNRYASEYRLAFANHEVDESLFWPEELERLRFFIDNPEQPESFWINDSNRHSREEDARKKGKVALFRHYMQTEGLGSALARTKRSIFGR